MRVLDLKFFFWCIHVIVKSKCWLQVCLSICMELASHRTDFPETVYLWGGGCFTKTFQTSQGEIFALLTCYAAQIGS